MAVDSNFAGKNSLYIIMNVPSLIPIEPGDGMNATVVYSTALSVISLNGSKFSIPNDKPIRYGMLLYSINSISVVSITFISVFLLFIK